MGRNDSEAGPEIWTSRLESGSGIPNGVISAAPHRLGRQGLATPPIA